MWDSVSEAEARRGGHPAVSHFPAGLASAILGTVARPPRLPALPLRLGSSASQNGFGKPGAGQSALEGVRVGSGASGELPGGGWGRPGLAGALPVEMARGWPGLPSPAASAGLPGPAGVFCRRFSRGERLALGEESPWRRRRSAPRSGTKAAAGPFVPRPPGGWGLVPGSAAGRAGGRGGACSPSSPVSRAAR